MIAISWNESICIMQSKNSVVIIKISYVNIDVRGLSGRLSDNKIRARGLIWYGLFVSFRIFIASSIQESIFSAM